MPVAFLKDFRDFAMKGNVVDLAVWVIIGTAFGKIVSSLVADVAMPTLGALLGGIDFSKYATTIHSLSGGEVTIKYGQFLQSTFDFLVIAFAVFIFVSLMNKTIKKPAKKEEAPVTPPDIALLEEIRDLLAGKKVAKEEPKKAAKKSIKK